jgi:hypothetical protein
MHFTAPAFEPIIQAVFDSKVRLVEQPIIVVFPFQLFTFKAIIDAVSIDSIFKFFEPIILVLFE